MEKRSSFSGKVGFILASASSAVGLGNIWRFPYLSAKYGGGIFLFVYVIFSITFGFALMVCEIAIGRKTGLSAIGAFGKIKKKYSFIGYITSLIPIIILPYYCVIGGWVMKYLFSFAASQGYEASLDGYFDSFIGNSGETVIWLGLFAILTFIIVMLGVEKGIEKASKIAMPILAVLSVIIAIYVVFLPGAWEGVIYYIKPDFAHFSIKTVVGAMGQLFYSMSLAMGIMITYGSYMKKDVNIEKSVHLIEIFDTLIAFASGLMIIPAVFAFSGGDEGALNQGAGLMFVTLPKVFLSMKGGEIIGGLFFLLVFFAALTSSVSMAETIVSIIKDKTKLSRALICIFVIVGTFVLGVPSCLGYGIWSDVKIFDLHILDMFDFLSNSILMPTSALLVCIFIGYITKPKFIIDEVSQNGEFKSKNLFSIMIKYVAPIFLVTILVSSVINLLGIAEI